MRLGRFGRAAIMVGVILVIAAASALYLRNAQRASVRAGLFAEIESVRLTNCEMRRFGEPDDGGYVMCANLLQGAKAAYSYGINGYDGWGCDASRHLSVTTHQYDCFNTAEPACPGGSTRFHAECIGPRKTVEDGRPFDTLESQLRGNGDASNHVIVKMDVEGAEWDVLRSTPADVLNRIDQLVVEFHGTQQQRFLDTMRYLKDHFHVVNVHYNNFVCSAQPEPFPAWAFEVLLVNKRLGIVDPSGRPQVPNPLDAPNAPDKVDCQKPLMR